MYRRLGMLVAMLLALPAARGQDARLADPMRPFEAGPAVADPNAPRPLRLSTVLISPKRRIAVINGGLYRVGDEIDGARITSIEAAAVRLRRGGEELVVRLTGDAASQGEPTS